jgi:DNA-binding GntR family transcriptional regulator
MLVVRASGRRSYITKWSSEDIAEVYTLRVLLESHAAERAATLISDATIHALKRSIEAIDKALAKRANARTFLDHNLEFHGLIMAASQSRRIYPILARLVPQPVVDRTALRYELSDMRQSISDHRDIVRALEAHDPALAKALMSSHIRRGYQTYIRLDEDGQKTK